MVKKCFIELKVCPLGLEKGRTCDNILWLAVFLKDSSKSRQLNVLKCLGYVHKAHHLHIRLIFKIPSIEGQQAGLIALSSLICKPRLRATTQHDGSMDAAVRLNSEYGILSLNEQFEFIQALIQTVMLLYSEGWLQKSIQSNNIVFFHYNSKINFFKLYPIGFEVRQWSFDLCQ